MCMKRFYQISTGTKRGRPQATVVSDAMAHASKYLEHNREECQFSFGDILKNYYDVKLVEKTIKAKLKDRYGEDIIISIRQKQKACNMF